MVNVTMTRSGSHGQVSHTTRWLARLGDRLNPTEINLCEQVTAASRGKSRYFVPSNTTARTGERLKVTSGWETEVSSNKFFITLGHVTPASEVAER